MRKIDIDHRIRRKYVEHKSIITHMTPTFFLYFIPSVTPMFLPIIMQLTSFNQKNVISDS